jgi:hypothetical protein
MSVRAGAKIAFMGAGGTGKTTDAKVISEKLGVAMMKSASRQAYEALDITEEDCAKMNDTDKWQLQGSIFGLKTTQDDNTYEFVADRTLLDHWAYCLMYCGAFLPNEMFTEYETTVRKHMKSSYTHMFYFPWGFWTGETDGVRQDHSAWQSAIDAIITGYCVRWNLPVVQVPQTAGIEARQEYIIKAILGEDK